MDELKANKRTLLLSANRRGALDPIDRFSEMIFGLIMVLTFTGTVSVGEAGEATVKTLLVASIGCNLAWGLVDACMFVVNRSVERARIQALGNAIRLESEPEEARKYFREALSDTVNILVDDADIDRFLGKVRRHPAPQQQNWVNLEDFWAALGVFLLVFLSTFPVVLPFLFVQDLHLAMRLSNGVGILLMFVLGVSLARFSNRSPWAMGLAVVAIGVVLVALTILLGG